MRVMARKADNPPYLSLLQQRRAEAGLSGRALAQAAGVSIGTVNMAERRTRGIYLQSAVKITLALLGPAGDPDMLFEPVPSPAELQAAERPEFPIYHDAQGQEHGEF